jgi:O-acetylserine/cysteine efflux transporter
MLAALRFLFAAIPAVLFVARPAVPWRELAAYGLAIGVFQFGLLFLGMKLGMSAGLASLVIQVQVFFTMGLAVAILRDRVTRTNIAGAAVAALGVIVLALARVQAGSSATLAGLALVIGAALAWATGNVVAKRMATRYRYDGLAVVVWSSVLPPVPLVALSWLFEGGTAVVDALRAASVTTWASVLFLAWGATLFCYVTWNRLLHRYPTALVAPFALLVPVSGLASGAIFLGESLSGLQAIGAVLVFAGLAVTVFGPLAAGRVARVAVR